MFFARYEATLAAQKSNHSDTLKTQHELAVAYVNASKYDLAVPLYEATLAALKTDSGNDGRISLRSQFNLAYAYHWAGKIDLAVPLYEATLAAQKSKLGDNHPDTLRTQSCLAVSYGEAGTLEKAELLLKSTLDAQKLRFSESDPPTSAALPQFIHDFEELSEILLRHNKFSEAEPGLKLRLKVEERVELDDWTTGHRAYPIPAWRRDARFAQT